MPERRRRRVVGDREPARSDVAERAERAPRGRTASAPAAPGRRGEPPAAADEPWSGVELDPASAERGLRGLVGGGSSQVRPAAALRARDAARPTAPDLARAEAELQIVRRNWIPRD
ncbi:MAG TPA: hypothetical protein VH561_01760 [Micromonosporaceae bacterium]